MYHTSRYAKVFEETFGFRAEALLLEQDGETLVYPYFVRPFHGKEDVVSTWYYGGPAYSHEMEFLPYWQAVARAEGYVSEFIRCNPFSGNNTLYEPWARTTKDIVYAFLGTDPTTLYKSLEYACQKNIAKAMKEGVTVSPGTIDEFHAVYQADMESKDAPPFYRFEKAFVERLAKYLLPKEIKFYVAKDKDGNVLASTLVLFSSYIAHDYLRGSYPATRNLRPNNLLVWEQMQEAQRNHFLIYDLVGGSGRHQVDGKDGVQRFKNSFSKLQLPFYTACLIHDQEAYDSLVEGYHPEKFYFPVYRSGRAEVG